LSGGKDFWARRKANVVAEAHASEVAIEQQALSEQHASMEEKSDEDLLLELNLPDPDAMEMGDDFSVFMSKAVPDRIRRRALRTLWRSNPVLANVDMLVDYGEDFTDSAMVVENMQTAYQVGKGMLKHVQEMARQAEELANPKEPEALEEDSEEDVEELLASSEAEHEFSEPLEVYDVQDDAYEELLVPSPRRMKFVTEGKAA
jgi:hypothetical protein